MAVRRSEYRDRQIKIPASLPLVVARLRDLIEVNASGE